MKLFLLSVSLCISFIVAFQPLFVHKVAPHRYKLSNTLCLARMGGSFRSRDYENNDDEEERDYRKKLLEADAAIFAAEDARRTLLSKNKGTVVRGPPPNSLARLDFTDAGTLIITIPRKGMGSGSLVTGAFSLAWFSAIIPATFASGGSSLLFMLPFWAAGGMVAKNAVYDPFVSGTLSIGEFAWELESNFAGKTVQSKEGPTDKLRGAASEVVAIVNERPQAEIKLYAEQGVSAFGLGLAVEELEYLAGKINDHLTTLREGGSSEI